MRNSNEKRRDNKGRLLYVGEYQEPSGLYTYHYTDARGRRHKLTSWTLTKADAQPVGKRYKAPLRDQIKDAMADIADGICYDNMTVLQLVDRYLATKTGVKHNTLANYNFVRNIQGTTSKNHAPCSQTHLLQQHGTLRDESQNPAIPDGT